VNSPSIESPAASGDDPTRPEAVAALVETRYGLTIDGLERLPIGQGTVNYRARTSAGVLFVKSYPAGTDLRAESEGIRLSALAASAGVPAAQPLAAGPGVFIARRACAPRPYGSTSTAGSSNPASARLSWKRPGPRLAPSTGHSRRCRKAAARRLR
jgi:hypothetical protein